MNASYLRHLLYPQSIAVIGASRDPHSVGYGVIKNLVSGGIKKTSYCLPFSGNIYPVNPHAQRIQGLRCYPTISALKKAVDMAVICVPATLVPSVIDDCAKNGVKIAVVISAGFSEQGPDGEALQQKMLQAAHGSVRIIGPNCLGILNTAINLNASFAPTAPPQGSIAFISQSGALVDSVIDWAVLNQFGFSHIISTGNQADLDLVDFLEALEHDQQTKVITLYLEGLSDGKRFMEVAQRVNRRKPIVVIKAGKTSAGSHAVHSHTASLAGDYQVYRAAFKQCGLTVVETIEELFGCAKVFSKQPVLKNNTVGIVTNGGGCGVLMADYCEDCGLYVPPLTKKTLRRLESSGAMHPAYSHNNPLDIVGDALPKRYEVAINTLLSEQYLGGLIMIQTLQTMTDPAGDAAMVIRAHKKFPTKPIICCFLGGKFSGKRIHELEEAGIPDFNELKNVAVCMRSLWDRHCWLQQLTSS